MFPRRRVHPVWLLAGACGVFSMGLAGTARQNPPGPTPQQAEFFETKVRPVLANNCYRCHGKDAQMSGLRLDTQDGAAKVLVAGDADKSRLIQAVRQSGDLKMPPNGMRLKPNEVADLETWVKMGAPWPKSVAKLAGPTWWSLQPVKKQAVPKVKDAKWVRNPIDAFILAKIEAKNLKPAPEADKRTLIRRVTYDLIGLPPTAAETDAFLADKSATAYEKVVDRLLASPHYGERWGRHWLDVARYADTKGYVFEEDRNYYNAYTYREWVIRSFNEDMPYDKFVTEQLAADRLPEVKDGDDKRPLAALGFLTLGRRFLNAQPDIIDDRIDTTMRGLQGFTVACARCHDHKFDPIPTQDYYSLYGVFASTDDAMLPISEKAIREPWEQNNARITATEAGIRTLVQTQVKRLREPNTAKSDEIKGVLQGIREETIPEGGVLAKLVPGFETAEQERLHRLQSELESLKKNAPPNPEFATALMDRPNPGDAYIFKRGNPGNNGGPAPRRFLAALSKPGTERPLWKNGSGRLELAGAIASKENPLTARVFVNRVWMHHFGAGIVRTPSDFGHQGDKPTHPELLDYLASTFMDNGWSIKRLHRLIVTSATYRQSSEVSPAVEAADPENRTWCRASRHRLDLEETRDSIIAVTGRLDLDKVGGKSVDIWSEPFTTKRSVYGFVERQNLPGIFRTFDFASPDSTNARRFQTTVPQQALFFMNSKFVVEQARMVADRTEVRGSSDDAQRVRRLYRLLFDRLPTAEESSAGVAFLKKGDPEPIRPDWQYGYGSFEQGRGVAFNPLTNFTADGYRVSDKFPDPQLGYITLAGGWGHPGHDAAHSVIRRWTAPVATTIDIEGQLSHSQAPGDGVHARLISSRSGVLAEWTVHNSKTATKAGPIQVQKGETLDFMVDPIGSDNSDAFAWPVTLRSTNGSTWDSTTGYGPPPPKPLTRLGLYAQALMMTNEFLFVD